MYKLVDVQEAVSKIKDGSTVGITGFMGSACPEYLLKSMEDSFLSSLPRCRQRSTPERSRPICFRRVRSASSTARSAPAAPA